MFLEKIKTILKGYIKAAISKSAIPPKTGGTDEADYCYSTWLRHLIKINTKVPGVPETVLELGPGDSLGIGIAALLSGTKRYIGLDIFQYWEPADNLPIFDKLVALYVAKAPLADESKYPALTPSLGNYSFPDEILTKNSLHDSLAPIRLAEIRKELSNPSPANKYIQFYSPWRKGDVPPGSVDLVFSQSVLQYTDLPLVYSSIGYWLKSGGVSSHAIDFSSHGITKTWNGHWSFSDTEWKHYGFGKKVLLNRAAFSVHQDLLESLNFEVVEVDKYFKHNKLKKSQLGFRFKNLPEEDLRTNAGYMLLIKQPAI